MVERKRWIGLQGLKMLNFNRASKWRMNGQQTQTADSQTSRPSRIQAWGFNSVSTRNRILLARFFLLLLFAPSTSPTHHLWLPSLRRLALPLAASRGVVDSASVPTSCLLIQRASLSEANTPSPHLSPWILLGHLSFRHQKALLLLLSPAL